VVLKKSVLEYDLLVLENFDFEGYSFEVFTVLL